MDKEFEVDLESGVVVSDEDSSNTPDSGVKRQGKTLITKLYGGFADGLIKADDRVSCGVASNTHGVSPHNVKVLDGEVVVDHVEKTAVKEKRKKSSNKKASKPPRPPKGPSLDAADQKLVKEISELAMLKRARLERMKALKKMKAAKASSNGNMFAMVFTILFCLVIIFQGISSGRNSPLNFQGSPASTGTTEGGLISVQLYPNPPASISNGPGSESPNMVEQVAGSDPPQKLRSAG
ncbi:uncharacterized protein LOC107405313 [Ziziphus jujuba]|uniref:Uncharacterized protein LOC107405313 n=1 Tax=Ziziphus jujuba TaxID=326968 RepID=A0A6P3YUP9_ZIZJJ|nr:uncharacterized protein LOC107405313 [Ziziphus jujuba]XP_015867835.3 uncharacterized protein LOC107405313 [Ziziphus jujuba]